MPHSPLARLRRICLALAETTEVKAWGEPTFRVHGRLFAMYASGDTHHGAGRGAVWLNCTPVNQGFMISHDPERFFKPPYVGMSGWIGVWLDRRVSWTMVREVVRDAHELTASHAKRKRSARRSRAATAKRP